MKTCTTVLLDKAVGQMICSTSEGSSVVRYDKAKSLYTI